MTLDKVLALECLADATRVDDSFAEELIDQMKPTLHRAAPEATVVKAFGLIASDRRPRGRQVFDYLVGMAREPSPEPAYAHALVATNLRDAADVLAELAVQNPNLLPLLDQMGNLAVPALKQRGQVEARKSMASLVAIGTPQAAEALADALGSPETNTARAAAIGLAQLTTSPVIEDALAHTTPSWTRRFPGAAALAWATQPFTKSRPEAEQNNLQLIYGRIIQLLGSATPKDLAEVSRPLDARLTICIFSFHSSGEPRKLDFASIRKEIDDKLPDIPKSRGRRELPGFFESKINRDKILAVLEERAGSGLRQLLDLTEPYPVSILLSSIVMTAWNPSRREWLAIGDDREFYIDGNGYHHRLPVALICIAAILAAVYMMLAGLHSSGWPASLDFAVSGACILGLIFIAFVPWNDLSELDVWADALAGIAATMISPLGGAIAIFSGLDYADRIAGVFVFLFTPAWIYGLFCSLRGSFNSTLSIVLEIIFITALMTLFTTGFIKNFHSKGSFRRIFNKQDSGI